MGKSKPVVDVLAEIVRVLEIEIEALESAKKTLTQDAERAVYAIADCQGYVFVTGVGKSGIIANKVAATLRSTGTPATFLHPAEALHGDIGMVRSGDVVLAIGKSGETTELNALLRALKRCGTFIIAITSAPGSSMASLSDIVLNLGVQREACPLNLAPTASTTAALAMGDAIAVAIMKLKEMSSEDFARHHPGGQLGRRLLLTVADVMRRGEQNPIVDVNASVREMLIRLTQFQVGALSVVDREMKLLGLITDYDVRKALEAEGNIFDANLRQITNPTPAALHSDDKAAEALEFMRRRSKPIAVLPVLNRDGTVAGMVHLHDLIAAGI